MKLLKPLKDQPPENARRRFLLLSFASIAMLVLVFLAMLWRSSTEARSQKPEIISLDGLLNPLKSSPNLSLPFEAPLALNRCSPKGIGSLNLSEWSGVVENGLMKLQEQL